MPRARTILSGSLIALMCSAAHLIVQPAAAIAASESTAGTDHPNFPGFLTPRDDIEFADWRAESAWPSRRGPDEAAQQARGVMGAIERIDPALVRRRPAGRFAFFEADRERDPAIMLFNRAFPIAPLDAKPARTRIAGDNVFIVDSAPVGEGEQVPRNQRNQASMTLRYVSAEDVLPDDEPITHLHTAWFTVFEPASVPPQDSNPRPSTRGVILLMPGLLATPEGTLAQLTRSLNSQGWLVVRMVAQPSRFLERIEFELDPASPDFPEGPASRIARTFDERGAECAYAAQAALEFVERDRPALRELPRLAIGFSGGAMTLPIVVARDPDAYDGAIMIGGGCDFWLMTQTSNYNQWIGAVSAEWHTDAGAAPTDAQRRALDEAYLKASRLDSYHTAQALATKPALVMLGDMDQAVPAPLGELLATRLERAGANVTVQREPMGHEALFMTLPRRFDAIHAWLDEHFPRATDRP
jgi:predicted esterase